MFIIAANIKRVEQKPIAHTLKCEHIFCVYNRKDENSSFIYVYKDEQKQLLIILSVNKKITYDTNFRILFNLGSIDKILLFILVSVNKKSLFILVNMNSSRI